MFLNAHSLDVGNFAKKSKMQPVLSSVCIKKDCCVACDGYVILEVAHDKQNKSNPLKLPNDTKPGLIPSSAALHASKNIPKPKADGEQAMFNLDYACTSVNSKDNTMMLSSTDIEQEKSVETKMVKGNYPDYESLFPEALPSKRLFVDAKYLKRMADYMDKHARNGYVEIQLFKDEKQIVFKARASKTKQRIRGMIMPLNPIEDIDEETSEKVERLAQTFIEDHPDVTVSVSEGVPEFSKNIDQEASNDN